MLQEAEPVMPADATLPVVVWHHPPANLPKPPVGVSRLLPSMRVIRSSSDVPLAKHGDRQPLALQPGVRPRLMTVITMSYGNDNQHNNRNSSSGDDHNDDHDDANGDSSNDERCDDSHDRQ